MRAARNGKIQGRQNQKWRPQLFARLWQEKSSLHSLCSNQELDVCSFLTLGYFLIGIRLWRQDIEGLTYHCLLHNREREEQNKRSGNEPGRREKGGNFLHSSRLRGRTKNVGKTMGNPLREMVSLCGYFSDKKNLYFLYSARNQCKFAPRFLFCGCQSNWNWGGVCKAEF